MKDIFKKINRFKGYDFKENQPFRILLTPKGESRGARLKNGELKRRLRNGYERFQANRIPVGLGCIF